MSGQQIKVLMVCLGNICRSPTAHGVFEEMVKRENLQKHILVDSAGTGAYHIGEVPNSRSQQYAAKRGYDLSHLRARQVQRNDYIEFDYILAMDDSNLANLIYQSPAQYRNKIQLFLEYGSNDLNLEVPDPYYTAGGKGFELVLDLVEDASNGLLEKIKNDLKLQ